MEIGGVSDPFATSQGSNYRFEFDMSSHMQPRQGMAERTTEEDHIKSM